MDHKVNQFSYLPAKKRVFQHLWVILTAYNAPVSFS